MRHVNYLEYDPFHQLTLIFGIEAKRQPGKPLTLLETWANAYGLGTLGSYSAFKKMLNVRQKIPILIDPFHQIYFFPTLSPTLDECCWINASQVKSIKSHALDSIVYFKDGSSFKLSIGRRSLIKQVQRCQCMKQLIQETHFNQGFPQSNDLMHIIQDKVLTRSQIHMK